jgi:hypothetical protein
MFLRIALIAVTAVATTAIDLASPANAQPLQPGPHSAMADVDLPDGTVQCTTIGCTSALTNENPREEWWRYNAPYDDIVAFLQKRFATGPQYDALGATRWSGLAPCYDTHHQSPPLGWIVNDETAWRWSDGAMMIDVWVRKPGITVGDGTIVPFGSIDISKIVDPGGDTCYRA